MVYSYYEPLHGYFFSKSAHRWGYETIARPLEFVALDGLIFMGTISFHVLSGFAPRDKVFAEGQLEETSPCAFPD